MFKVIKSSQIIVDNEQYKVDSNRYDDNRTQNDNKEKVEDTKALEKKMNKIYEEKINYAQKEAERIINEAYENAKTIIKQAKEDGYEEGKNIGYEDGRKEADSIIQEALAIKRDIEFRRNKLIKTIEPDVINLTISTIEKILNKRIEEDYEIIEELIKLALDKCAYTENLAIRVSPEDYDYILNIKDKVLALSENVSDIEIKQDKSLKQGSCIIDTPSGSIDSGVWTQFEQVKTIFEDMIRSE